MTQTGGWPLEAASFSSEFRLDEVDDTALVPNQLNIASRVSPDAPLLVFLAGSGHPPADYRRFLAVAGASGLHVLGLDYPNRGRSVVATCGDDPDCYTRLQRNRFLGVDPFRHSTVDGRNSVLNRLVSALERLSLDDPDGGWERFDPQHQVDWTRIIVAGHSQGGGQAAFIAHHHRVLGQITFGAPIIAHGSMRATWLATPGSTPTARMFAFASRDDKHFGRIVDSWNALGLPGDPLVAPVPVPGEGVSHRLVSSADLGGPVLAHGRVVNDETPLGAGGTPLFAPVWLWMLERFAV